MSHNVFGRLFRFTTWGESHGPAIGCVVDGVPPGVVFKLSDVQLQLDRRRPGVSRHVSPRNEPDVARILSGVLENPDNQSLQTTGAPISIIIENTNARPNDYNPSNIRPGHADFSWRAKYHVHDWRGGGRSSARETASRVAAGALARLLIPNVLIQGYLVELGGIPVNPDSLDPHFAQQNPLNCPDPKTLPLWEKALDEARSKGSSLGAVAQVVALNVPPGWGAPLYGRLDADIAAALMSINAVKGVEIGDGFNAAKLRGEDNADQIRQTPSGVQFLSNHAGGILGGVSTGQHVIARFAVKPTSSILIPMKSISPDGKNTDVSTKGRHDPCVGIRAVPVGEAMLACVLADHMLRALAQNHPTT